MIPGLYASGNAGGNAFGRVYPGPGATVGQGLVYGYIAARHAAGRLAADPKLERSSVGAHNALTPPVTA